MLFPVCKNMTTEDSFYSYCVGCKIKYDENKGCTLIRQAELGKYLYPGTTPSGGESAILYFRDENDNPVEKWDAKFVEIQELDDNGRLLNIEHGTFDPYALRE
ncbi:MAG: hypothetical protein JXR48_18820 [Candidatus Delongbacteria bacterium]|nr:hypothetical protein [Candidatus Delongbacteria bacterium]MBN2837013.1 hypothetical protein [Candidatus Delongbacteria bacterium]